MINAKTKVISLLGNPIEHSKSPQIHNSVIDSLGLNYVYVAHKVDKENVKNAVLGLKALGYVGSNVTVPYKLDVMPYLDQVSEEAKLIGAVNTITVKNDELLGDNTDCYGFAQMLRDEQVSMRGKNILILGTGGAARAVTVSCMLNEAASITVCSRSIDKSSTFIESFSGYDGYNGNWFSIDYKTLERSSPNSDIVVNSTPLGMHPKEGVSPVDPSIFNNQTVLVDLIYNPDKTEFLLQGSKRGMKTINGLGMLIHQALKSFEIWTGLTQSAEFVRSVLNL